MIRKRGIGLQVQAYAGRDPLTGPALRLRPPRTRITIGQFLRGLVATRVWLAVPVGMLAASLSVWNAERAAGGAEWSPFVRSRQRIRDRKTARLLAKPRDHKLVAPPSGSPWTARWPVGVRAAM